jgi:hypothetical protein
MTRLGRSEADVKQLCCDKPDILNKCRWTDCLQETFNNGAPRCNDDESEITRRYDQDNGGESKVVNIVDVDADTK